MPFVTDDEIGEILTWLAKHVDDMAAAKADRWEAVEGRKVKKAYLMNQSNESAENAKERYAYSHPDYVAYLKETRDKIYEDQKNDFRRDVYDKTIEAWRTQQATIRSAEKIR